jgi:thioredoxin 1
VAIVYQERWLQVVLRRATTVFSLFGGNTMGQHTTTVTDDNFQEQVLKSSQVTLVDFWAEWCGPCRALAPVLEQVAESFKGRAQVGKMNIDEHPNVAGQYAIRSIPTLLVFKNGQVVDQLVGLTTRAKLEEVLNKHV